jgi:BCD family chlorophyll transporter-like MFS transporter
LLVLSGGGQSHQAPVWIGWAASGLAFLLVGAGIHITQTVGLALATDLAPEADQPKVVGLMYVMQLLGMIVSALVFGMALNEFSPAKLIQVIQASALITIVLNVISLWKQEPRSQTNKKSSGEPSFIDSWRTFAQGGNAMRRLVALGFGTMAFSMNEVLLEPYGGQILGMSVSDTTMLTAILAAGGLIGFSWASRVLSKGTDPFFMASMGALVGIPAFILITLSAPLALKEIFLLGTFLIGFGGGLFSHGTLTATMQLAPSDQRGLALGAWGAVQATAAGIAIGLGGVIRDLIVAIGAANWLPEWVIGPATGYSFVYCLEIGLLIATIFSMTALLSKKK